MKIRILNFKKLYIRIQEAVQVLQEVHCLHPFCKSEVKGNKTLLYCSQILHGLLPWGGSLSRPREMMVDKQYLELEE